MSTTVVQIGLFERAGPRYDVRIHRPSRFGNPYRVGRDGTQPEVVDKYRAWIQTQPALLAQVPALRGKRLGCLCPGHPCHGDVLVELADA